MQEYQKKKKKKQWQAPSCTLFFFLSRSVFLFIFHQRSIERHRKTRLASSVGHHCDEDWQMCTDNPSAAAEGQI